MTTALTVLFLAACAVSAGVWVYLLISTCRAANDYYEDRRWSDG